MNKTFDIMKLREDSFEQDNFKEDEFQKATGKSVHNATTEEIEEYFILQREKEKEEKPPLLPKSEHLQWKVRIIND